MGPMSIKHWRDIDLLGNSNWTRTVFFFFLLRVESTTDKSDKCIEFKLKHGPNRVDLLSESTQKWDLKKLGYPCFCERVIMGYVWVNMGCVRAAYGFPKTWFCHNMGCVRYDYGFARDIYGIYTGIYGILRHFLTFFLSKIDRTCYLQSFVPF